MTPDDADRARRLLSRDRFATHCGIALLEVGDGHARASLEVRPEHLNGVGVVQGGAVFTLADFAFAAAVNSHGTVAVAVQASVSFLAATRSGTLVAEAREISRTARLASCEVRVTDGEGRLVATFAGVAYRKQEAVDAHLG
jgi:acyl-CoA thioesterase